MRRDFAMLHLTGDDAPRIEEQQHVLLRVAVEGDVEDILDLHLDTAFLAQLANDRVARIFARFDLPSRELPKRREVSLRRPLGEQDAVAIEETCGGDEDGRGGHGRTLPESRGGVHVTRNEAEHARVSHATMLGMSTRRFQGAALALLVLGGCSSGGGEDLIVPAGTTVDAADAALSAQIADNDALDGPELPMLSAFARDALVHYWDLGPLSAELGTVYLVCRAVGLRCDRVDHPPVVERVPGDAGYNALLRVQYVPVTDAWAGEQMPSAAAIAQARRRGLVDASRTTSSYINLPIVGAEIRLAAGGEGITTPDPSPVYYDGVVVQGFDFAALHGELPILEAGDTATIRNVYLLTRDGEDEPISEPERGEDLTEDGDETDSSNVFAVDRRSVDYTPLWRMVEVTVASDFMGIDSSGDERVSDYTRAEQLFTADAEYNITPGPGCFARLRRDRDPHQLPHRRGALRRREVTAGGAPRRREVAARGPLPRAESAALSRHGRHSGGRSRVPSGAASSRSRRRGWGRRPS